MGSREGNEVKTALVSINCLVKSRLGRVKVRLTDIQQI